MSNLDLKDLPPDLQATLTKKETDGERKVRLIKDLAVFFSALAVTLLAFIWAAWVLLSGQDASLKPVAISTVSAIVGGFLGYILKK